MNESKVEKRWSPPLSQKIGVWWNNFKHRGTGRAYRKLCKSMQDDPSYAHSWMCNITMPIYDNAKGKLTIHECNDIADRLMQHLFSVKNSGHPEGKPTMLDATELGLLASTYTLIHQSGCTGVFSGVLPHARHRAQSK